MIPWYVYVVAEHGEKKLNVVVKRDVGTTAPKGPEESAEEHWHVHAPRHAGTPYGWAFEVLGWSTTMSNTEATGIAHQIEDPEKLREFCLGAWPYLRDGYDIAASESQRAHDR